MRPLLVSRTSPRWFSPLTAYVRVRWTGTCQIRLGASTNCAVILSATSSSYWRPRWANRCPVPQSQNHSWIRRAVVERPAVREVSNILRESDVDRTGLLKIDVEKAELDVLEGIEDRDWR